MPSDGSGRLGGILLDAKVISETSLQGALERQRGSGKQLGAILIEMGLADEKTVMAALGVQRDMAVADLRRRIPDLDAVARVPERLARTLRAAPLRRTTLGLEMAVANPLDGPTVAELEKVVGGRVLMRLAAESDVGRLLDRSYSVPHEPRLVPSPPERARRRKVSTDRATLEGAVAGALRAGATEIRLDSQDLGTRLRSWTDGEPAGAAWLPGLSRPAVEQQILRLAGAAGLRPQGPFRFTMTVDRRHFRILLTRSALRQGHRVRLRVLMTEEADGPRRLDRLGMPAAVLRPLRALLKQPSGLILVAGPRGSGRTTTAYAAAVTLAKGGRGVVLLERSLAHLLPSVAQIEVGDRPAEAALVSAVEDRSAAAAVVDGLEGVRLTRAAGWVAQHGVLVVMTVTADDAEAATAPFLTRGMLRPLLGTALRAVVVQGLASAPGGDGGPASPVFSLSRPTDRPGTSR